MPRGLSSSQVIIHVITSRCRHKPSQGRLTSNTWPAIYIVELVSSRDRSRGRGKKHLAKEAAAAAALKPWQQQNRLPRLSGLWFEYEYDSEPGLELGLSGLAEVSGLCRLATGLSLFVLLALPFRLMQFAFFSHFIKLTWSLSHCQLNAQTHVSL